MGSPVGNCTSNFDRRSYSESTSAKLGNQRAISKVWLIPFGGICPCYQLVDLHLHVLFFHSLSLSPICIIIKMKLISYASCSSKRKEGNRGNVQTLLEYDRVSNPQDFTAPTKENGGAFSWGIRTFCPIASVQGINDSPFLPHRAMHSLQLLL